MITRDIELQDSILDLLDNCVDGVLRSIRGQIVKEKPYEGFKAEIIFNEKEFIIRDNCGGIPESVAKNQAFMLGRASKVDDSIPTVGMYGIGMKRAIFKMGRSCKVISETSDNAFKVEITPEWMSNDNVWELELVHTDKVGKNGTSIHIENLLPNISELFKKDRPIFEDLPRIIAQHYSFIIEKGFTVYVNGHEIKPKKVGLLVSPDGEFQSRSLTPYIYKGNLDDGLMVSLAVGFHKPMIDSDDLDEEQKTRRSSADAGWTIVCNDRVVLYNDKTILTGWGEAGVPSYHTQFIGILGIVFFNSNDASKLPLTTTKRGVETSSKNYLYVKNYMREGLKKFTDYTNYWKGEKETQRAYAESAKVVDFKELVSADANNMWTSIQNRAKEKKLNLPLMRPVLNDPLTQIKFYRKISEIEKVKLSFYESDSDAKPSDIGAACFDYFLNRQSGNE